MNALQQVLPSGLFILDDGTETKNHVGRQRKNCGIIGRRLHTTSYSYTQRVIAARVGCTQASVSGILKKKMVYGNVKDAKIPGRKRKTSQKEDRIVVRKSKADRFKTASQIKAEMQIDYDVDISVSTTRRRLREAGLNACRPRKKPRLTARHKKKR